MDQVFKRILDVAVSGAVLLLSSPILVVAAVAIRLTSRGPALYRAVRVGQGGRTFRMLKFRTMVVDADRVGPCVTAAGDPRITRVGGFLRKSKIDELPQLWNVLRGEMSLVGPRPNVPELAARYSEREQALLSVPQGITDYSSLWFRQVEQMLEGTGDVMADYERRVQPIKSALGLYYAEHARFKDDVKILWATFTAIVFKREPWWCFPPEARAMILELQVMQDGDNPGIGELQRA